MNKNIEDFGAKIGGARKDVWAARGLMSGDLAQMNRAEREKYVKKDNIWRKPDYKKLVEDGMQVKVAYYIKVIRDSLPVAPPSEEAQERYVEFIGQIRDAAMAMKTEADIAPFYSENIAIHFASQSRYHVELEPEYEGLISNKTLQDMQKFRDLSRLSREIKKKQFCYTEEQKALAPFRFFQYSPSCIKFETDYSGKTRMAISVGFGTIFGYPKDEYANPETWKDGTWFALHLMGIAGYNYPTREDAESAMLAIVSAAHSAAGNTEQGKKGKGKFLPPQLAAIRFTGVDFRNGKDMTGQDYLDTFGFHGGEFGTWLNQKDRQESLNMGFESLAAMAKVLDIAESDISLCGHLSIAFGARGKGGSNAASAHYEPLREVINLTKMKGAGSLAHEWGHAFDDILNTLNGGDGLGGKDKARSGLTNAQIKLHRDFKRVSVLHDEKDAKQMEEKVRGEAGEKLRRYIMSFLPKDDQLTEDQIAERDSLVHACMDDKTCHVAFRSEAASVQGLSAFKKSITGRGIQKDDRRMIAGQVSWYQRQLERAARLNGTSTQEPSEYLKESQAFDKKFSKTDHGYWSSECEMFARAFACYVHDKCREAGIVADYLVGHAEAGPVPRGEERKQLNADFDALIAEFKNLGLLHGYGDHAAATFEKQNTAMSEAELFEAESWASSKGLGERDFGQLCLF